MLPLPVDDLCQGGAGRVVHVGHVVERPAQLPRLLQQRLRGVEEQPESGLLRDLRHTNSCHVKVMYVSAPLAMRYDATEGGAESASLLCTNGGDDTTAFREGAGTAAWHSCMA